MYNSSGSVAFFGAFLFLMHLTFRLNCKVVFSFASSSPVSHQNILVKNLCKCTNRVLKWWCHKNEISEIMGFVRIFWKNNVQEAYFTCAKNEHFGANCPWDVSRLYSENSIQKNLKGFVWSFLSITGLQSQRQFARPKCSFLASRPLGHCSFRISW